MTAHNLGDVEMLCSLAEEAALELEGGSFAEVARLRTLVMSLRIVAERIREQLKDEQVH